MNGFDKAYRLVSDLATTFRAHEHRYTSADYQEAEARKDFIDKFWKALGWDVDHETQKNPYEQEVKVERGQQQGAARKRADYSFSLAPNFRDVRFFVEAKKPHAQLENADDYFQTVRYGWNSQNPLAVLTDFEQFHILDCRYKPSVDTALSRAVPNGKFHYTEYLDTEKFARIYWLFSREAVAAGSIEKFEADMPKPRGRAVQRGLFPGRYQSIDESFLDELDDIRADLARGFKKTNSNLSGEDLTELVQRTIDRLVFIRFLEDRLIENQYLVSAFGDRGTAWQDFIAASRRLDGVYNGIVFKRHATLDDHDFAPDDALFSGICENLSHINSPYDFNAIPIHILGSIYERFLGKVIVATDRRARVEEKPEVRKAGGVYYTPEYIVRYIVDNTVGKLIEGKSPAQIADMKFADIACGSGSFLLGVYDLLIRHHAKFYNDNPSKAKKGDVMERDDGLHLTLQKKREILLNNIFGADIDAQAVEVAQLSLYLKLLQDETPGSARTHQLEFQETLLPSLSKNITCGNSLIGTDILSGELFEPVEERKLNPMDFEQRFPEIMQRGGFDAVVGNPPYLLLQPQNVNKIELNYFQTRFRVSQYKMDIFHLFIERALSKTRDKGLFGYITPASFLTNNGTTRLRTELLESVILQNLVVLPDGVFKEASVDNVVVIAKKESQAAARKKAKVDFILAKAGKDSFVVREIISANQRDLSENKGSIFRPMKTEGFAQIAEAIEKRSVALGSIARVNFGMQLRDRARFRQDVLENPAKNEISAKHRKCLGGSDVQVYRTDYSGLYCLFDRVAQSGGCWDEEIQFAKRKMLVRQIGKTPVASLETEGLCCLNALFMVKALNTNYDEAYFLGLVNSKLLQLYWSNKFYDFKDTFPKIKGSYLEELPIRKLDFSKPADKTRHSKTVSVVDQMLLAKKQLAAAQSDKDKDFYENKCAGLERQIDVLVYDLYGLTESEIKIVESA